MAFDVRRRARALLPCGVPYFGKHPSRNGCWSVSRKSPGLQTCQLVPVVGRQLPHHALVTQQAQDGTEAGKSGDNSPQNPGNDPIFPRPSGM